MKTQPLFVLPYEAGAIPITEAQARLLFTDAELEKGEARGEIKHFGPWQIIQSYRAICTSNTFNREVYPTEHGPLHVYGKRVLSHPRESGYQLEGSVSIGGKSFRAFTSSQLFELPNGKLINAATIHACDAASE